MPLNSLNAISPIDGRYHEKTKNYSSYFSEYALIKYRVLIEIEYFLALSKSDLILDNIISSLSKSSC